MYRFAALSHRDVQWNRKPFVSRDTFETPEEAVTHAKEYFNEGVMVEIYAVHARPYAGEYKRV